MENLHAKLPKLRKIELQTVYLYPNDGEDLIANSPVENVTSFILQDIYSIFASYDTELGSALTNWLKYISEKYISEKYRNLDQLEIQPLDTDYSYEIGETTMITALSKMTKLTNYAIGLYPLTKRILNTMDMNRLKLTEMELYMFYDYDINLDFQYMQSASSTLSLNSLNITVKYTARRDINTIRISHSLIGLCKQLQNLTHLEIDCSSIFYRAKGIFLHILQNLTSLESLKFKSLNFTSHDNDLDNVSDQPIQNCRMKSLESHAISTYKHKGLNQINPTFEYIIRSCPLLERFKISGHIYPPEVGALNLNFTQNIYLNYLEITMWNCKYYMFNHIPEKQGKKWRDFNNLIKSESLATAGYHINLAWQDKVQVRLYDCNRSS